MSKTTPIFEIGQVPKINNYYIQHREYRDGQWMYFLYNSYNAYASGWATEDFIIQQINTNA